MGFFDELVDSISKTAHEVSGGAKNMAEKNRIQKQIASIEKELRDRFQAIGMKYFAEICEEPAPEYTELVSSVTALQETLRIKKAELNALSGMVACPGCGKLCSNEAKFCAACGTAMPVPEIVEAEVQKPVMPTNCAQCGAALSESALFCAGCGAKIEYVDPAAAPAVPPVPDVPQAPAEETPAVPQTPVCSCCGSALSDKALFCAECGTKAPGVE